MSSRSLKTASLPPESDDYWGFTCNKNSIKYSKNYIIVLYFYCDCCSVCISFIIDVCFVKYNNDDYHVVVQIQLSYLLAVATIFSTITVVLVLPFYRRAIAS